MNTAKVYHNADGEECTIHQMVREEPQWAAERIQAGETAIKALKAEIIITCQDCGEIDIDRLECPHCSGNVGSAVRGAE